jgi:hypothetical protein
VPDLPLRSPTSRVFPASFAAAPVARRHSLFDLLAAFSWGGPET